MPIDVATPIWACTICGARFGTDLQAAARCEDAGPPRVLPGSELLLDYRPGPGQGFTLHQLHPLPGRVGTLASAYTADAGHVAYYLVDCDPAQHVGADGTLRLPSPEPARVQSDWLTPHQPGTVNVRSSMGVRRGFQAPAGAAAWIADAVGLSRPGAPADADVDLEQVRALTDPVKAVLDALGASIVPARGTGHPQYGFQWSHGHGQGALAAEAGRGRDGAVNRDRARWWLHSADPQAAAAEANARWQQWRDGQSGDVPTPRLVCPPGDDGRALSASKLSRRLRDLVAATGVPWPARTSATAYIRTLITETLGFTMPFTDLLFPGLRVVAFYGGKGGVGKSTAAAAFARRAAATGRRVTVVDCDLTGPTQHVLFNLGRVLTDPAAKRLLPSPTDVPGLSVFSAGQVFASDAAVQWDAQSTQQWLSFVGSSLDLDEVDLVVLDLPAGDHPVYDVVFDPRRVTLTAAVHVTSGHRVSLAAAERSLDRVSRRALPALAGRHVLVENLSRAAGLTEAGQMAEIRLVGDEGAARALGGRFALEWGGSLPWAPDPADLAQSPQMADLVDQVLAGVPCPADGALDLAKDV